MQVNKIYNRFIDIVPFIMVIITMACACCYYFDFYIDSFKYLSDLLGYSILTNLVFLRIYRKKVYCSPTKVAVYGLILMNVISIITIETKYYSSFYDLFIGLVVIIIVIVGIVKRW